MRARKSAPGSRTPSGKTTQELRERFEARSDTSVAFQDFCREYAEGRVTTAVMRRARGGNPCTCYVGGLNWDTKEETLRELFDVYGSVQSVDIQEHAHTQRSKGWALVEFATAVRPVWRSNFRHPTVPMTA